MSEDIYWLW